MGKTLADIKPNQYDFVKRVAGSTNGYSRDRYYRVDLIIYSVVGTVYLLQSCEADGTPKNVSIWPLMSDTKVFDWESYTPQPTNMAIKSFGTPPPHATAPLGTFTRVKGPVKITIEEPGCPHTETIDVGFQISKMVCKHCHEEIKNG